MIDRARRDHDAPSGQREPHGGSKPLCGKKRGTSSLRGELFLRRELDVDPVLLRVCVRDRLDLRNLPGRRCRLEEVAEALGVAVYMGGGPSAIYAAEALAAWDELTAK